MLYDCALIVIYKWALTISPLYKYNNRLGFRKQVIDDPGLIIMISCRILCMVPTTKAFLVVVSLSMGEITSQVMVNPNLNKVTLLDFFYF